MRESKYQADLIRDLRDLYPGCIILKNDSGYLQGVPDLLVLYQDRWAGLEVKQSDLSPHQPNQDYYVELMYDMSFAAFISPDNEGEVLTALSNHFGVFSHSR